jgi:hypothetical protein
MEESPDGPLTEIRCVSTGGTDDNPVDLAARRVTINVAASESVTCTFIDGWELGDLTTYTQTQWGDLTSAAGSFLNQPSVFDAQYPSDLVVGGLYTLTLTVKSAVFGFLPSAGTPGVLTGHLVDPLSNPAGEFAGEVVGLTLNRDFSSALGSLSSLAYLAICDLQALPVLNGHTIDEFITIANRILGGSSASFGASTATSIARLVNSAFADGTPSTFAQTSLYDGACP